MVIENRVLPVRLEFRVLPVRLEFRVLPDASATIVCTCNLSAWKGGGKI